MKGEAVFVLLGQGSTNAALVTFTVYLSGVFFLAWLSNRLLRGRKFLSEYFLGSRSLGVWAFALTFAATSASGGSFTGFPSKIYTHGWILALWIASYMVVPLCAMGLLAKRINQVARLSGSITVPDVLRDRFNSPALGLAAVCLLIFFMSFNLVAQFKSGSEILRTMLQDVGLFHVAVQTVATSGWWERLGGSMDPAYTLCLLVFALVVVAYTAYGGFHAVVWTDVLQGVVMVGGVLIMLPLVLWEVGGLPNATRQLADMEPPRLGTAALELVCPPADDCHLGYVWFSVSDESVGQERLFRVSGSVSVPAGRSRIENIPIAEIRTPSERMAARRRLRDIQLVDRFKERLTRLKQSQLKCVETPAASERSDSQTADLVNLLQDELERLREKDEALEDGDVGAGRWELTRLAEYDFGAGRKGVYVYGPGPVPPHLDDDQSTDSNLRGAAMDGFLPLSLAVSFFFMWSISGAGQPSSMVRLMAFRSTGTLRRAIFTVAVYYSLIYFPLVVIFCCARILLPGMELESDRIMPQMAVTLTQNIGQGWLAGLLVAAPFAAVMSTVDSFLLMISSALVRDVYQRNIHPEVSERAVKRMSYTMTVVVGVAALAGALNPPRFLQDIIVYTGSGLAACFLAPVAYALYWPRATSAGCLSGMIAGFLGHLALYVGGIFANGSFYEPYRLFQLDPIIFGLLISFLTVPLVSRWSRLPDDRLVALYFYRRGERPL